MNYWLFTIMYDWYPESWPVMLEAGIAAQHYPPGWTNEARNIRALRDLRRGDALVAAFKDHRFAGYGPLISDFRRSGPSLNIEDASQGPLAFAEGVDVEWTAVPLSTCPPYIHCRDLKAQGFDIDLKRGLCVRTTDEKTFRALKARIDAAGARPYLSATVLDGIGSRPLPEEVKDTSGYVEGRVQRVAVDVHERSPEARRACIAHYGFRCVVCGQSLGDLYGEAGRALIHVHHLRELSNANGERAVDPIKDLRPVCPNCHAIIHNHSPVFTIEQVRGFLRRD